MSPQYGELRPTSFVIFYPSDKRCAVLRPTATFTPPHAHTHVHSADDQRDLVSDIAIFVLKRDVKLQLTN